MMRILFRSPLRGRWLEMPVLNGHISRCRPGSIPRDYQRSAGCRGASRQGANCNTCCHQNSINQSAASLYRLFRSCQIRCLWVMSEVIVEYSALCECAGSLRQLYRKAMTLEVDFFQAAVKDGRQPNVGLLVLDFDETLSVSDTTSVIIDTARTTTQASTNGELASMAMDTRCTSM